GPAFVLPSRSAHPHVSVYLSLHQQWAALLSGAEILPLQSTLGRQRDGQTSQ
ncbi:hypothetical protein M9458_035566, partial [Cirrhinus mrigala]